MSFLIRAIYLSFSVLLCLTPSSHPTTACQPCFLFQHCCMFLPTHYLPIWRLTQTEPSSLPWTHVLSHLHLFQQVILCTWTIFFPHLSCSLYSSGLPLHGTPSRKLSLTSSISNHQAFGAPSIALTTFLLIRPEFSKGRDHSLLCPLCFPSF